MYSKYTFKGCSNEEPILHNHPLAGPGFGGGM